MRPHVTLAAIALSVAGQFVGTPTAAAEPPIITTIPETSIPPGQTTFTDNPAIVGGQPASIQSWSRLPDPKTLAVHFTSGTPECFGVHASVQETTDIVAVKLRSGSLPEAVDRACIALAVFGTLTVPLDAPVGNRAVVSIT
jgi:hypothetical protein